MSVSASAGNVALCPTSHSQHGKTHAPPAVAEYAQVTRMLGNGRLEAFCFDGVNRLCHIRGKLRKRVWIGVVSSRCTCAWAAPPAGLHSVLLLSLAGRHRAARLA